MSGGNNTSPSPHMSRVYGKRPGRPRKEEGTIDPTQAGPREPPPIKLPYLRFLDPVHQRVKTPK